MVLLLKSAKIIDANSPFHHQTKDILVEDGIIKSIENQINKETNKVIELNNLHLSPGWFDSSVSFGEPGFEERETLQNGLDTAMKSGFTHLVLNPNTNPVLDNSSFIQHILNKSASHIVDILPTGALTERSEGQNMAELFDMYSNGAVAFGDYKRSINDANLLKIAMQYSKSFQALIQVFSLDQHLSTDTQMHEGPVSTALGLKAMPRIAEVIQLKRDLELVKYTDAKVHFCCISTAESVSLIEQAKNEGLDVTCSVALSNLYFTDKVLESFDSKYKIWPPLRETSDQEALIEGLKKGIIDMVTCDHLPLNIELKNTEFEHAEFGSIGLESAFGALNKLFGLDESVEFLTRGKSRFNATRTHIDVEQPAVLSLFDPDINRTFSEEDIHSKSKNAIFEGEDLKGKVYGIINNGKYYVSE